MPILASSASKSATAVRAMLELQAERLPKFSFAEFSGRFSRELDVMDSSTQNFAFNKHRDILDQLVGEFFFWNRESSHLTATHSDWYHSCTRKRESRGPRITLYLVQVVVYLPETWLRTLRSEMKRAKITLHKLYFSSGGLRSRRQRQRPQLT